MTLQVFYGLLIPFLGTTLGACCVFFVRGQLNDRVQRGLGGFAAGVMTAASVWSLLIPAIDQSQHMGKLAFIPAAVGFLVGIFFLLFLDHVIPHLHMNAEKAEGPSTK
ncbi:MAG: ZIP family metal transporter, partial [Ruminococcus sp.]|nr:ZIP family metal transporter [Ruminococcus sp.]